MKMITATAGRNIRACDDWRPPLVLGNYTFLTLCVEIKKANLYRVSRRAILGRFSNTSMLSNWSVITRSMPSRLALGQQCKNTANASSSIWTLELADEFA
jgi:hypothetical protein